MIPAMFPWGGLDEIQARIPDTQRQNYTGRQEATLIIFPQHLPAWLIVVFVGGELLHQRCFCEMCVGPESATVHMV